MGVKPEVKTAPASGLLLGLVYMVTACIHSLPELPATGSLTAISMLSVVSPASMVKSTLAVYSVAPAATVIIWEPATDSIRVGSGLLVMTQSSRIRR